MPISMSSELSQAYSAAFNYEHKDTNSNQTAMADILKQYRSIPDSKEKAEFAMNLAIHSDYNLSKLGQRLLQGKLDGENAASIHDLQAAASQLMDKVSTTIGGEQKEWAPCDDLPDKTKVQLWQLSRDYDLTEKLGLFDQKQHHINTVLCDTIAKKHTQLTEKDAWDALQVGENVDSSLVMLGMESIAATSEKYHSIGVTIKIDTSEEQNSITPETADKIKSAMEKLTSGQTLMLPIHHDDHYGSIQITKIDGGIKVCVFDSLHTDNSPYRDVLSQLGLNPDQDVDYCMEKFQKNNDCAVHVHGFFKHCSQSPHKLPSELFEGYKNQVRSEHSSPSHTNLSSQLRRQDFVMDALTAPKTSFI